MYLNWQFGSHLHSYFPIVRNSIITLFLLAQVNFVLWAFTTIFFNGAEGKPISCLESIFYIFFGKHDFVASIDLGSLNDNESALKHIPTNINSIVLWYQILEWNIYFIYTPSAAKYIKTLLFRVLQS